MLPSTVASFISALQYFGDHPPSFMGLEPLFLTIAATAGCAGLGYLIGPLIGSSLWRATHRRTMSLIEARDREFHHHIVRNRVDPTRQSATNPVPDFYGEKVGSMKQYRQWLRDQARFRRKSTWETEKLE